MPHKSSLHPAALFNPEHYMISVKSVKKQPL